MAIRRAKSYIKDALEIADVQEEAAQVLLKGAENVRGWGRVLFYIDKAVELADVGEKAAEVCLERGNRFPGNKLIYQKKAASLLG